MSSLLQAFESAGKRLSMDHPSSVPPLPQQPILPTAAASTHVPTSVPVSSMPSVYPQQLNTAPQSLPLNSAVDVSSRNNGNSRGLSLSKIFCLCIIIVVLAAAGCVIYMMIRKSKQRKQREKIDKTDYKMKSHVVPDQKFRSPPHVSLPPTQSPPPPSSSSLRNRHQHQQQQLRRPTSSQREQKNRDLTNKDDRYSRPIRGGDNDLAHARRQVVAQPRYPVILNDSIAPMPSRPESGGGGSSLKNIISQVKDSMTDSNNSGGSDGKNNDPNFIPL